MKPSRESRRLVNRSWKAERPYNYLYRRIDELEAANPDVSFAKLGDMFAAAFCGLIPGHEDPVCATLLKALLLQHNVKFPWGPK